MNNVIFTYILKNFLKTFLIVLLVGYSFGIILNLFEEIEFFKNVNVSILKPLLLTSIYVPSMIINLMPFIIFVSSMVFMVKLRNSKDLLTLKVYGYSNIKIFSILAFTSFFLGWLILIIISPITSSMVKYYEITKSQYARDIDHLVTFNKNGLWIKENLNKGQRIISAKKPEGFKLIEVMILHLDENSKLVEKIVAEEANIKSNKWDLKNVQILMPAGGVLKTKKKDNYEITSIYDFEKINSLFKNFNTVSFIKLITNYNDFIKNGYSKIFLTQSLHLMLSLPFFLFLMTALASIFTLNSLQKSDNFKLIVLGLITCVLTFYLKDLSLALGQTDRIPIILAIWSPVIALSFFTFIGVLQINEK